MILLGLGVVMPRGYVDRYPVPAYRREALGDAGLPMTLD